MTPGERFDAGEMVVKPDGLSIAVRNAGCSGVVFIAEVIGFVYELRYAATPDDDQTLVADKATRTAKSGSGILLVEFACGTRQPRLPFRKTCGQSGSSAKKSSRAAATSSGSSSYFRPRSFRSSRAVALAVTESGHASTSAGCRRRIGLARATRYAHLELRNRNKRVVRAILEIHQTYSWAGFASIVIDRDRHVLQQILEHLAVVFDEVF